MTKFLHIVEQNLPNSEHGDQYDLLMKFKSDVNNLYMSKQIDFKIVPIQGTGSIEIISRDGKSIKLIHRAPKHPSLAPSEEAEDIALKSVKPDPIAIEIVNQADPNLRALARKVAVKVAGKLKMASI